MEEMVQNANPGLARRFPIDSAFVFEDFDDSEMTTIFDSKLKSIGFKVTDRSTIVAREILALARSRPHFGNAGEVDILLNKAKIQMQKRISLQPSLRSAIFEAQDFDPDFERSERATTNVAQLFDGVIGFEKIVSKLQDYQTIAANAKARDMDPRELRGPPSKPQSYAHRSGIKCTYNIDIGAGKTSTARKMGKVYYDMGFLANAQVVECSAKDMVAEYIGQTGPKTQKLIESALGKVLFIDEAYRLAEGHFAKEAVDELVDCVTKPKFYQKVIIILAGYEKDIKRLTSINSGFSSRFPGELLNASETFARPIFATNTD